jgi:hypothetical protein
LALVLVASASPSLALADTDPQSRAAAQALFDDGKVLVDQKKYQEACPKFLDSYRLDPAIGTKFYLARCYEQIGKLASAWTYYLEVVDEAHAAKSADREKFAAERASALKPRLPKLSIAVSGDARRISGLAVKRDGVAVGEGSYDAAIPTDLGDHVISATAPGRKPFEKHVEVKEEGAQVKVEIPLLEVEKKTEEVVPPKPDTKDVPEPKEEPVSRTSTKQGIAGLAFVGLGAAGLAVGAGLGGLAMSKLSQSNSHGCNAKADTCLKGTEGPGLRQDALHAATGSTAGFVAGGIAAALGIVLVVTAPTTITKTPTTVGFGFGPGSVRLRLSF